MISCRFPLLAATAAFVLAPAGVAQVPFTQGNVVVVRVGDGTTPLSAAAAPLFLDEYVAVTVPGGQPAGTLVQSIALPTVASGLNRAIVVRGNATSEAYLGQSTDGVYLMVTGYDAPVGAAGTQTQDAPATTTNRIVARIDSLGNVDTTTALNDSYGGPGGNPRAVASDNGQRFWLSGTSTSSGGIRFVANLGDSTTTAISGGAPTNTRVVSIFDGQLYTTSASTVYLGVCTVGNGLSTTGGQSTTLLPGFPTTGGVAASSAYDHFFADPNTLYVADDNAVASTVGGINKWTFDAGTNTWVRQYRLQLNGAGANTACRGLTGFVRNGVATLWATMNTSSSGADPTQLCVVTDTGPGSVVTSLATSATNTAFRGVRFLPKTSSITRINASCGAGDIATYGNGEIGTAVRTKLTGSLGFPLIGYGLNLLGLPLFALGCPQCTAVHDFAILVAGSQNTLQLPNTPSLVGTTLYTQGVDFLAPGGCPDPLFTVTDGFSVVIQ